MSDFENPAGMTINITSNNQTGGITAHTVNIGREQRHLSEGDKGLLTSKIPKDARIEVQNQLGDVEAHAYRMEIQQFLVDQGYSNIHGSQGVYSTPDRGQGIYHAPGSNLYQIMIFTLA